MRKTGFAAFFVLLIPQVLFFCNSKQEIRPEFTVTIDTTSFVPDTAYVRTGTRVVWINKDQFVHTVVSGQPQNPDHIFGSNFILPGDTFSYEFDKAGTFPYYCSIHYQFMHGMVMVDGAQRNR